MCSTSCSHRPGRVRPTGTTSTGASWSRCAPRPGPSFRARPRWAGGPHSRSTRRALIAADLADEAEFKACVGTVRGRARRRHGAAGGTAEGRVRRGQAGRRREQAAAGGVNSMHDAPTCAAGDGGKRGGNRLCRTEAARAQGDAPVCRRPPAAPPDPRRLPARRDLRLLVCYPTAGRTVNRDQV